MERVAVAAENGAVRNLGFRIFPQVIEKVTKIGTNPEARPRFRVRTDSESWESLKILLFHCNENKSNSFFQFSILKTALNPSNHWDSRKEKSSDNICEWSEIQKCRNHGIPEDLSFSDVYRMWKQFPLKKIIGILVNYWDNCSALFHNHIWL